MSVKLVDLSGIDILTASDDTLREKLNIPEDAQISRFKSDVEPVPLVATKYDPPELEAVKQLTPEEIEEQIRNLPQFTDFENIFYRLPFVTPELVEKYEWFDLLPDGCDLKKECIKRRLKAKKEHFKKNRSSK